MSHGGHSFHKKDWALAAGAAALAATGAGAAGIGPLAGLMGAGEAAGAAGLGGAGAVAGDAFMPAALGVGGEGAAGGLLSGGTAALAGDAYMPGALGASGTGAPSFGQVAGGKMAGLLNNPGAALKGGLKGLSMANKMGAFSQPAAPPPMPMPPPSAQYQPKNTVLYPQANAGSELTPEKLKALLALLQQQQQV